MRRLIRILLLLLEYQKVVSADMLILLNQHNDGHNLNGFREKLTVDPHNVNS